MQINTKSPVHIGSGSYYTLMDSYMDGNELHRVNLDRLFEGDVELLKRYTKELDRKNLSAIMEILKRGKDRYSAKLKEGVEIRRLEDRIMECIKDSAGDIPYIPGSSLKGFLRTALMVKYLKDNGWYFEVSVDGEVREYNLWEAMQRGIYEMGIRKLGNDYEDRRRDRIGSRFENLVVYTGNIRRNKFRYDAKYDIFKYLLVGDFYPESYDIWIDKAIVETRGRRGSYTLLEVVEGKFYGYISLSPQVKSALGSRDYPLLASKLELLGLRKDDLSDIEGAEKKMIAHIKEALGEYIEDIKNFEKSQGKVLAVDGANARIGFGTGSLYKTFWIYMRNNLPREILQRILSASSRHRANIFSYPKSRYVLSDGSRLGWIKLD